MATLTTDEIVDEVRGIFMEMLEMDESELPPGLGWSLTTDLELESIDHLDVILRMEKAFSTPERRFKIYQGELFPGEIQFFDNPAWIKNLDKDFCLNAAGVEQLKAHMPHIDFSRLEDRPDIYGLNKFVTMKSLVDFVEAKLAEEKVAT